MRIYHTDCVVSYKWELVTGSVEWRIEIQRYFTFDFDIDFANV